MSLIPTTIMWPCVELLVERNLSPSEICVAMLLFTIALLSFTLFFIVVYICVVVIYVCCDLLFVPQCAILIAFNTATILFMFLAVVSLDLRRQEEGRVDIFCCFKTYWLHFLTFCQCARLGWWWSGVSILGVGVATPPDFGQGVRGGSQRVVDGLWNIISYHVHEVCLIVVTFEEK